MAGFQKEKFVTLFCVCSLVLMLAFLTRPTTAAFFYVQESQDKCFIESVPTAVALTATYKNHDNPGVTCSIIFKDPSGRSVYSREVLPADTEGKVAHMTVATGEYQVCISCASSKWFNTQLLKWSLSIELGDTDISIDDLAKKDHVNSVHLKLQSIARRVEAMQAENDYERVQFFASAQWRSNQPVWNESSQRPFRFCRHAPEFSDTDANIILIAHVFSNYRSIYLYPHSSRRAILQLMSNPFV
ncbi:hypothetical protein Esti_003612 [Eimeria stiedai]